MKNNNIIIVGIVVLVVAYVLFIPKGEIPKEYKKMAGETVGITTNAPASLSGQIRVTFTLSSQTGVNLWKIKAVTSSAGWSLVNKEFTGASGTNHNEVCSLESDGYYCNLIAETGSTVAKTVTLIYTAPSSPATGTFSGTWETYSGTPSTLQNSQPFTTSAITFIQACGSGNCVGTQIWSGGSWGICSTNGNDCGICCKCSSAGIETEDLTQSGDCTATTCPLDGCGLGGCGTHIFSDYPVTVANTCSALKSCTSNSCTTTCTADTDGDTWAGSFPSFSACYDCNNALSIFNPSITDAEECGLGEDRNCNGATKMGNTEADRNCDADTTWSELDAYITAWAISTQWGYPLPSHTITWSLLDIAITKWATE